MIHINTNIKVDKNKVTIEFKPTSSNKTIIKCTVKQLLKKYKVSVENLSISIIRQIIKDKSFNLYTTISFDSKVTIQYNKEKTLKMQLEDNLAHINHISTGDEYFCPLEQIKNFYLMTEQDFIDFKTTRKPISPLTTNIETNETRIDLF